MITDKPSRIGYLQQLIDCVQPSVAVDPRKIAAGASTAPRSFRGLSRKALRVRVFARQVWSPSERTPCCRPCTMPRLWLRCKRKALATLEMALRRPED